VSKIKSIIIFNVLIIVSFFSCDPGYDVILQNKSGVEVNVDLKFNPDYYKVNGRDIFIIDSLIESFGVDQLTNRITIHSDSLSNQYTFNLNKNSCALIDHGRNSPHNNLQIIINNFDTLGYRKSDYRVIGNFMSKTYLFTIESNKY
jgi:hypothetical protein